jgi:hypothetical protein
MHDLGFQILEKHFVLLKYFNPRLPPPPFRFSYSLHFFVKLVTAKNKQNNNNHATQQQLDVCWKSHGVYGQNLNGIATSHGGSCCKWLYLDSICQNIPECTQLVRSMTAPGDHFDINVWVPVSISNSKVDWLCFGPMWKSQNRWIDFVGKQKVSITTEPVFGFF